MNAERKKYFKDILLAMFCIPFRNENEYCSDAKSYFLGVPNSTRCFLLKSQVMPQRCLSKLLCIVAILRQFSEARDIIMEAGS